MRAEYELVREELESLKSCITSYTGYALAGAGIGATALAAVYERATDPSNPPPSEPIALGLLSLSLLGALMLLVLIYKFNSHNRYAAYSMLLGCERASEDAAGHMYGWEFCMSTLRAYEGRDRTTFGRLLAEAGFAEDDPRWDDYWSGRLTRDAWLRGPLVLLACLFGTTRTKSWSFPPHIVALFGWITFGFLAVGVLMAWDWKTRPALAWPLNTEVSSLATYVLIVQVLMWYRYGARMYSLLRGVATVEAYFWRFLPIRIVYLEQMFPGIRLNYVTRIGESISPGIRELPVLLSIEDGTPDDYQEVESALLQLLEESGFEIEGRQR